MMSKANEMLYNIIRGNCCHISQYKIKRYKNNIKNKNIKNFLQKFQKKLLTK